MKASGLTVVLAPRVWIPALVIGILLIATGIATGPTGSMFVLACVSAALYVFALIAQGSADRLELGDVARLVILLLVIAVPVLADGYSTDGVNLPKFVVVVVGAITLGIVWMCQLFQPDLRPRWRNGLRWPLLALLAITIVSALFGQSIRLSLLGASGSYDGVFFLAALVVIVFACAAAITLVGLRSYLLGLFLVAGLPVTYYALIQFRDRLFAESFPWLPADVGVGSTLGNANHLGGFIAMILPIGLALAIRNRGSRARIGMGVVVVAMLGTVLLARSEGALVAMVAGLAVFGAGLALRAPEWLTAKSRRFQRLLVGLVPVAITVGLFAIRPLLERFAAALLSPDQTSTVGQRFGLWDSAVEMASDRLVLGWGPDAYRMMFPTYQSFDFVQAFGPNELANGAHNLFFNQLATTGFLGLVALLLFVTVAYLRALAALSRLNELSKIDEYRAGAGEARTYVVALIAGMTAYLAQAGFNVQQVALTFTFFVLVGLVEAVALDLGVPAVLDPVRMQPADEPPPLRDKGQSSKKKKQKKTGSLPSGPLATLPLVRSSDPAPPLQWTTGRLVGAVGLVLLGLIGVMFVSRPYRAARAAYEAQGAMDIDQNNPPPVERRFDLLDESADLYVDAFKLNRWEYSYARGAGNAHYLYGVNEPVEQTGLVRIRKAADWYGVASDLRPRDPEMYLRYSQIMSEIYSRTGLPSARADALDFIRRAFAINPWDPIVGARIVNILRDLGDFTEARDVLRKALLYRPDDAALRDLGQDLNVPIPNRP